MRVLLVFDDNFLVDKDKLMNLLQQKSKFIKFALYKTKFSLGSGLVSKPKTFTHAHSQIKSEAKSYDKIFCFTV
jgi:hypothetical protein